MASFKISAPGRIFLSGEHTVLYGKKFLMTSLNLRTILEFYELPNTPENNIKIELDNINLKRDISFENVKCFFFCSDVKNIISNSLNLHAYVRHWVTVKRMWTTHQELRSLQIFFFLLYSILHNEYLTIRPFRIKVSSNIPIRAGLGSSTSFAVCLAACFLHWKHLQNGNHTIKFNNAELETIKRYTETCEKSMEIYAFGVDAHVCTYGQMVICQHSDYIEYKITDSTDMAEIAILLIDSNFYKNKCLHAEQMAKLMATSLLFDSILYELELLALSMFKYFKSLNDIIRQKKSSFKLSREHITKINFTSCIEKNQELLTKYNLSAKAFENVSKIARKFNLMGKLTGFGGNNVI
ncbi:mevalonate kinase-like isoform X2 [Nylanderia fulva]|uniref:mevalonate kinase-like isoform X2 n=1 Tax=Nylanderia fulva TaxID=613905 RepID=UPI0010FB31C7|nr:mevalonate kinase-like isoform X2 [Nylanderia fulva]